MKKKSLLLGLAALALAMTYVGCQSPLNPENVTTTEAIPSVGDPTNVQAKAYPGAIVVSWDPVRDATGYEVYRRDNTTQATVYWTQEVGNTYVADILSSTNPLVHDRSYTYVIIALSGQSTYTPSRAVLGEGGDIVWNGQSSVTVRATVPSTYTVPALTGLSAAKVSSFSLIENSTVDTELVKVSWTALEYNPGVQVRIDYTFGGNLRGITQWASSDVSNTLIPLVGGENTIYAGTVFGDGTYFPTPTRAQITQTFVSSVLPTPNEFTITRDDGNTAYLTWTPVEGAASYEVYKAKAHNSGTSESANITLIGSWEKVDVSTAELVNEDGKWVQKVADADVAIDKTYLYTLVAINTTVARSLAKTAVVEPGTSPVAPEAPETFTADRVGVTVQLKWDPVEGATSYEISKKEITFIDEDNSQYTVVDATGTPVDVSGQKEIYSNGSFSLMVTDANVPIDKAYLYEIAAVNAVGKSPVATATTAVTDELDEPVSLTAVRNGGTANLTWTTVEGATSYEVYRAKNGNGTEDEDLSWELLKVSPTKVDGTDRPYSVVDKWTATDSNATLKETYKYAVVAVSGSLRSEVKTAELTENEIPGPTSFSAQRVSGTTAVKLTWQVVSGATGYEIYKAESVTNADTTTTLGSWTPVTVTPELIQPNTLQATEFNVDAGKNYTYIIMAVTSAAKGTLSESTINTTTVDNPNFSIEVLYDKRNVRIAFANKYDSYKLSKAPATFSEDAPTADTVPVSIGEYEALTTQSVDPAWISYNDTPKIRSSYRYKLEVTKNGVTTTYYKNLVERPFADTVDVSISAVSHPTIYKNIKLTFTGFDPTDSDLSVFIYRAESVGSTSNTEKTPFTLITEDGINATIGEYIDNDSTLNRDKTYVYRFDVKTKDASSKPTVLMRNIKNAGQIVDNAGPAKGINVYPYGVSFSKGSGATADNNIAIIFNATSSITDLVGAPLSYEDTSSPGVKYQLSGTISNRTLARTSTAKLGALPANSVYYDLSVTALPYYSSTSSGTKTYYIYASDDSGYSNNYLTVSVQSSSRQYESSSSKYYRNVTVTISNSYSGDVLSTEEFRWDQN